MVPPAWRSTNSYAFPCPAAFESATTSCGETPEHITCLGKPASRTDWQRCSGTMGNERESSGHAKASLSGGASGNKLRFLSEQKRFRCNESSTRGHPEQEHDVALRLLQLVQHQFHGFDWRHSRESTTQDNDLVVLIRMIEQLLFARTGE